MKKLTSTHTIPPESIIRIYKKGYGYTKIEVIESNDYYLAARCSEDFWENIHKGDELDAYLWINHVASFDFTINVLGSIKSNANIVFLSHTNVISFSNERKCLMADVSLPVTFFVLDKGNIKHRVSKEDIIQHDATIVKLSDREAIINCDLAISEQSLIKCHLTIKNKDKEIIGKVSQLQGHELLFTFNKMSDKERNEILEFVFSIYRE